MGIPRVRKSDTAPVPAKTVPITGTGTYRTINVTVWYETHGTIGTHGFVLLHPLPLTSQKWHTRQLTCGVHFAR
jgi:hypothetical protein